LFIAMSEAVYNWQRLWYPRAGTYHEDGLGYPLGPSSYNTVFTFDGIAEGRCLVLLGEPGMGKTHELRRAHAVAHAETIERGGDAVLIDLRQYASADEVRRGVFEHPQFQRYLTSAHELELFIDSLDECRVSVRTVGQVLAGGFNSNPVERLRLRIACRTADWTGFLEGELRERWGEDNFRVYELLPLRRGDIAEAATAQGHDAEAFLQETERRQAVPLTTRPTTLRMLLSLYGRGRSLPGTRAELYQQGCLQLSEETNESRRDSGRAGPYSAEQCMVVAGRIAAVMAFSGRGAVWRGARRSDAEPGDVLLSELRGGEEAAHGEPFRVDDAAIRQTLIDTGFFTAKAGTERFGWTHATYGEFLAAWYLTERGATTEQIMRFLVHPGDGRGRVAPQLYEVAAWLAGMMPEVFDRILGTDPKILLRIDEAATRPAQRAALTDALLRLYEEKRAREDFESHSLYRRLAHPGLAPQLEPYIRDAGKHYVVRRVATEIAEACNVSELQGLLADITLADEEPLDVRISAAGAVSEIGDIPTKRRLKDLAARGAAMDGKNELKGYALSAVWPEHMTAEELFASLTPPTDFFHGSYDLFLSQHLVPRLQPEDLPTALRWAAAQDREYDLPNATKSLIDSIMVRALEYADTPGVLDAFADAAIARLRLHDKLFETVLDHRGQNILEGDDALRRRALASLLDRLPDPKEDWGLLVCSRAFRVLEQDSQWLIEIFEAAEESSPRRLALEKLIPYFFVGYPVRPDNLEALDNARQRNPAVKEAFEFIFKPVVLGTEEAAREQTNWRIIHDSDTRRTPIPWTPAERASHWLEQFEGGDLDAWWRLNLDLQLEPHNTHYTRGAESDLTKLPGWQAADEPTRQRIVEAAKRYVLEGDPRTAEWIKEGEPWRSAEAGYRALRLLLNIEPSFVEQLSPKVWAKWAPTVLLLMTPTGDEEKESPHRTLMTLAYRHAPDAVINALLTKIDIANREGTHLHIPGKLKHCWDEILGQRLLAKAKEVGLKRQYLNQLLYQLLEHNVVGAQEFAESLIPSPFPADGEERERAVLAARNLVIHAEDCGWPVVWRAMNEDDAFARHLVESVSQGAGRRSIGSRLVKVSEESVADLYVWMARRYPPADDPEVEGVHTVSTREAVGGLRNSLLQNLKAHGTPEAVGAIERIMRELPDLENLYINLLEAEEEMLRRTWVPRPPAEVINFTNLTAATEDP
jgi:predicted NACHT family NTPase